MTDERLNDLARAINAEPDKLTNEELTVWYGWWGSGNPAIGSLLTKLLDWHHEEVVHEVKEEILDQARYLP